MKQKRRVFSLSKKDGITIDEWEIAYNTLVDKLKIQSKPFSRELVFNLDLSPEQGVAAINEARNPISKNQKRIVDLAGFSDRLRKVMNRKGVSQSELARRTGLTQPAISVYLSNKNTPRPISRQKIAYALKVSYLWLSWGLGEMKFYRKDYPEEQFHMTFGDRLSYLIWQYDISIKEIAYELKFTQTAVGFWVENLRFPRRINLIRLCKKFNWDFNWLKPEGYKELKA